MIEPNCLATAFPGFGPPFALLLATAFLLVIGSAADAADNPPLTVVFTLSAIGAAAFGLYLFFSAMAALFSCF